jgi:hypothetical protein
VFFGGRKIKMCSNDWNMISRFCGKTPKVGVKEHTLLFAKKSAFEQSSPGRVFAAAFNLL